MQNLILNVDGMTCQGCVNGVKQALATVAGVAQVDVDLANHRAEVVFDEQQTNVTTLIAVVEEAGFDASL